MKTFSGAREIMMIRPYFFGFNNQTAGSNAFQNQPEASDAERSALAEAEQLMRAMSDAGIVVHAFDNTLKACPDAVFPNNWFSTHPGGTWIKYPMAAENRRLERRADIETWLNARYTVHFDFSQEEQKGFFLEGTGSLLIDHVSAQVYAALSVRTDEKVFMRWAEAMHMQPHAFTTSYNGVPVYHTNVVMALLAGGISMLCSDVVVSRSPEKALAERGPLIKVRGEAFLKLAANCIALADTKGDPVLLIGTAGWNALPASDRRLLESEHQILPADIPTIEQIGGGGVRCMVAELYDPSC